MKILLQTIPHRKQRYNTLGDWFEKNGMLCIRVSQLVKREHEILIAIHELIEAVLCAKRGISEDSVMNFDEAHPELEDPGDSISAPYHFQHEFAKRIERMMCGEMGIDWEEYEKTLEPYMPPEEVTNES